MTTEPSKFETLLNNIDLESIECKHCGRCVLAGPPCCYQAVIDLWHKAEGENRWLRKVQSKQSKKIHVLETRVKFLEDIVNATK